MKQVQLHEKMGKRKKSHETVKKVEKSPSSEGETFKFSQISIGEEFKRWATVRESMCLSDEQLMKAILDLCVFYHIFVGSGNSECTLIMRPSRVFGEQGNKGNFFRGTKA